MAKRRKIVLGLGLVLSAALAFGLIWFQPWKLFLDETVNEKLPAVALAVPATQPTGPPVAQSPAADVIDAATPSRSATDESMPPSAPSSPASARSTPAKPSATLLSRGNLISHEHDTSGTVSVVRQPDGSRVLAIANLDTSNGPDVHVWLTDAPVLSGEDGWYVFDDGAHISLGTLKGNIGNQLYTIPAGANLSKLTSVSIWCERFDVSFGAAELEPAG